MAGPSYAARKQQPTAPAPAPAPEPESEYPIEKGGGWWECSDGFKVQDENEAREHEASLS